MTLASSGSTHVSALPASSEADRTLKTAFDCDILTLARDAKQHASQARHKAIGTVDPMDALYRPLGNRDVQGALTARSGPKSGR